MIIGYWIDSITIGAVVERMNQKSEPDGLQYVWDAARYHYEWEGYDKEHCEICRRIFATTPIGGRLEIIEGNGSKQLIRDVKEKR